MRGRTTEFDGARLALWELAHGSRMGGADGLWAAARPWLRANVAWPLRAVAFVVVRFALALLVAAVRRRHAATAQADPGGSGVLAVGLRCGPGSPWSSPWCGR